MRFTKFCGTLHPADEEAIEFWMKLEEGAELTVKAIPNQRTHRQNAAIHAFLGHLGMNLNEAGFDLLKFHWKEGFAIPWNLRMAKENLWVPVQIAVTGKEKTSDLTTAEVDQVYQPLAKKISQMGVQCPPMGRE